MTSSTSRPASGLGLATVVASGPKEGTVLDVWYPRPALGPAPAHAGGAGR